MSGVDEVARLLTTAAARAKQADHHEAEALRYSKCDCAGCIARSANHFTIAAGLRGQARFRQ